MPTFFPCQTFHRTKYLQQLTAAGLVCKQKSGRNNFYINEPLFALLSGVTLE